MSQYARLEQIFTLAGFDALGKFALTAGIREGAAQKHKDRDSIPYGRALDYLKAARQHGVIASVQWLMEGRGEAPYRIEQKPPSLIAEQVPDSLLSRDNLGQILEKVAPLSGANAREVPIKEAREIPAGAGSFMLVERTIRTYAATDAGVRAYAFFVQTDDAGKYERGDRVLVDPDLPLMPGKDVVILTEPDSEGRQRCMIGRLLVIEADRWKLGKSSQPDAKAVWRSRSEWPNCHRIVGLRNG